VQSLFNTYKTTNEYGEVVMDQDGIENFMQQIGVDPTKLEAILISMYMGAQYMGEF